MQVLKLGGSAITKKQAYMKADLATMRRLALAVAEARKKGAEEMVIAHGAGSFGHAPVLKYKLNDGVRTAAQRKGLLITQKACAHLSSLVAASLKNAGVDAVSIAPHRIIASKNRRIVKFNLAPVRVALAAGKVPVLYGDMVPDSKLGFSVCSGDQIVAYLGRKAKRMVLVTNVDGVLVEGKVIPLITKKNFLSVAKHITGSSKPDVTGGMAGKIREIMSAKRPAFIVNAKKPERVLALLLGKKAISTEIRL